MLGAVVGDIVGSRFERKNYRGKDFEWFRPSCRLTDDSVMTLAIAQALLQNAEESKNLEQAAIESMQSLGKAYPLAGYGLGFRRWLIAKEPKPYQSFGNGAAMRVSPCAYAGQSLEQAQRLAYQVTRVSHDHPLGLLGAEAEVTAIYLALQGEKKETIRQWIIDKYYALNFCLDDIRESYRFDATCQGSLPQAFCAFFEAESFEETICNAISIGGDSDTIGAMAGAVAGAYYGVPEDIAQKANSYLDERQKEILHRFEAKFIP